MNKANYTENGNSSYPITTESFDFIQNQILLLQQLTMIYGNKTIFTNGDQKYVIINGELLPLNGSSENNTHIKVVAVDYDVTANGETYKAVTTTREAVYTSEASASESYAKGEFNEIKKDLPSILNDLKSLASGDAEIFAALGQLSGTLDTMQADMTNLKSDLKSDHAAMKTEILAAMGRFMPKYTIIDFAALPTNSNVPSGWAPLGQIKYDDDDDIPILSAGGYKWVNSNTNRLLYTGTFNGKFGDLTYADKDPYKLIKLF